MLMKKLSDYAEVISGFAFDSNLFNDVKGMPLVRIRDIRRGYTETYTTEEYKDEYIVKKDDILIGMDGEFNISKWKSDDALLNQRVCKVNPINTCNGDFIYYSLPFKLKEIENSTSFATVKHISLKQILNIDIPDYSLEEQNKIAMKLNLINNMINNKKHQLFKLDELIKSQFVEMFGTIKNNNKFAYITIGEVIDKNIIKIKKRFKNGDKIKYIDISSIDSAKNVMSGYTDYKVGEEPSRAQQCLRYNDIVVSTVRPNLKNIAMNKYNDDNIIGTSGFCVLRSKGIRAEYLMYILLSDDFTNDMSSITTGANYPAIHNEDIYNYKIPNAPLELQNKFSEFVKQVDKQKFEFEKQLKKLEELQASLMQEYFG